MSSALRVSLLLNAVLLCGFIFYTFPQTPLTCPSPETRLDGRLDNENQAKFVSETSGQNIKKVGSPQKSSSSLLPPPVIGQHPSKPREDGWVGSIERVARNTSRTSYNPDNDAAYTAGLFRCLTPLPSMTIEVRPGKTITMDDAIHAYDIWFEEYQVFDRLSWLGVSMQQDPADAMAIQQMLFHVKPDLVIEIGTNTGGGAIFYSSIMRMYNPQAKVVTVDIRPVSNWRDGAKTGANLTYCDRCILGNEHPFWTDGGIVFIHGHITGNKCKVIDQLQEFVDQAKTVLVIEDAGHAKSTVALHTEALHRFVSVNSYMLVQDTKLTRLNPTLRRKKGGVGPVPAVEAFIKAHDNFVVDRRYEYLMYSQHHWGWLRKTRA